VLLGFSSSVSAALIDWDGEGADNDWTTPENWVGDVVPTAEDQAKFAIPGAVCNVTTDVNIVKIKGPGQDGGHSDLNIMGGSISVSTGWVIALTQPGTVTLSEGGSISGTSMNVGGNKDASDGKLHMTLNSGNVTITGALNIPITNAKSNLASGHVQLDGGTLSCANLNMRAIKGDFQGIGTMDVAGGILELRTIDANSLAVDQTALLQGYIDSGWITAYDANGTFELEYDPNDGTTTLRAIHKLNPSPAPGSVLLPGDVELSWTLSDPCVPGQPVLVDVYFTDNLQLLQWFTDPAAIQLVNQQVISSVVVQTQPKTQYFWAVDTYIGDPNDPIWGPIFTFSADHTHPEVNAGRDVVTWLVDGVRTGTLDATVIDDGLTQPYTVQWTVISEPNDPNSPDAAFADASVEDATITLSALGAYVLQLARISHNPIEKSSLFWYNILKTRKLTRRQGAVS